MMVKEVFIVAGLPTTFGLEFARNYPDDAPTVRCRKDAGAVILGKTSGARGLADYQSDNLAYGRTNSPYHLAHSLGGLPEGSAAARTAAEGCGAPVVIGVMSTGGWR